MSRYPEKKQNKKAAVQHLVHVNGHWLPKFGGRGGVGGWVGFGRKKKKKGKKTPARGGKKGHLETSDGRGQT